MSLDIDTMTLNELREIVKCLARNINHNYDILHELQIRVLELEMCYKNKKQPNIKYET